MSTQFYVLLPIPSSTSDQTANRPISESELIVFVVKMDRGTLHIIYDQINQDHVNQAVCIVALKH